jgi:hypothetical protein
MDSLGVAQLATTTPRPVGRGHEMFACRIYPGFCFCRTGDRLRNLRAFEDPVLLRIYRWGFLFALLGLVTGLFGVGKKTPLRWKAPVLSTVLLLLWMGQVMGE